MAGNKSAREKLEAIYGKKCMVEEAGIRKIPVEKRRKIKGYKKFDEQITFHHIEEKSKGGRSTTENGALVKWYNHQWIHSLSEKDKEEVNKQLIKYKAAFLATHYGAKGQVIEDAKMIETKDKEKENDLIIPTFDCDEVTEEVEQQIKENRKKKLLLRQLLTKQYKREKREFEKIRKEWEDR